MAICHRSDALDARTLPRVALAALLVITCLAAHSASAKIYNWQTGDMIPGTWDINPGPHFVLSYGWDTSWQNLRYADLAGLDLDSTFIPSAWLDNARFTGADLSWSYLNWSTLTGANLSNANLTRAEAWGINLTGAKLTGACLSGADLNGAIFTNADLSGANLTSANLTHVTLTNAKLAGATVAGACFEYTTGFTQTQLQSTASYRSGDLHGIELPGMDLSGLNLAGQDLTGALFYGAKLGSADLSGSRIAGASFGSTTLIGYDHTANANGLTLSQLQSTASYQSGDLHGVDLSHDCLTGWSLANKDLTGVSFDSCTLTNTDISGSIITDADLCNVTGKGFTQAQLQSTASYQRKDLHGINFAWDNLSGWDLSDQNLTNASFLMGWAPLDMSRADIRGVKDDFNWGSPIVNNMIHADGSIYGLDLAADETLYIRDYDGGIWIRVHDKMTLADTATIDVILADEGWDSPIMMEDGVTADLRGILSLEFAPGSDLARLVGTTFWLFNWNRSLTPGQTFGQVVTQPGLQWDLSNLYTTGEVTLTGVPEPASLGLLALGGLAILRRRK